jgi:LCP family protein required for cell wall assembly
MRVPGDSDRAYGGPQSELYGDRGAGGYPDSGYRDSGYRDPGRGYGGDQPPPPPPPPPPLGGRSGGRGDRPRRRRIRPLRIIGLTLVVLLLAAVGLAIYVDTSLSRVPALADYPGRPAAGAGTNWLLVGSDSRAGLSEEQKKQLATGDAAGQRTDTMMLVHIPDNSVRPTLVSLPRDSSVTIPGHGTDRLNAAFPFGGAALLVKTVEGATGLRIDHYMEIGFGGLAGVVDAVGGVNICVQQPISDPKAGLKLNAGCQNLDGAQALGYVRTRATPRADLDRVVHQREFLSALLGKAAGVGTLINPFRSVPLALSVPDLITVADGDHLWHIASFGLGIKGGMTTTTVPFASVSPLVVWDKKKSGALFTALRDDLAVPPEVITG